MGSTEKFCLRWNDFESNISVSFRELRDDKDFFDITLACEDEQIQAHKVILSACSPFFRSVLKRNRHEHPLLYLKGVKFTELQAVLNFMYQGEVNVAQEDLNSFLAVAEDLKVKGLTQSSSATASPPHKSARARPEEKESSVPTTKRPRVNSAVKQRNIIPPVTVDLDPPALPVKSEPAAPPVESHAMAAVEDYPGAGGGAVEPMYGDEFGEFEGGYGGEDQGYDETMMDSSLAGTPSADGNKVVSPVDHVELDQQIEDRMTRLMGAHGEGMLWSCDVCSRRYKDKTKMRHHIETHLDNFVCCPICSQLCKTRRTLKTHIGRSHGKEVAAEHTDTQATIVSVEKIDMEPKHELN